MAHGTHGRIFDRRERSDRRAEKLTEGEWPAPNPRAGKPVPRGMGFPAHVGATADRAGRVELRTRSGSVRRTEGFLAEHVIPDFGFILII